MGLYEVPLTMSLLGFGMGTILANFHMCGIMLVLKTLCKEKNILGYFSFYKDNISIKHILTFLVNSFSPFERYFPRSAKSPY